MTCTRYAPCKTVVTNVHAHTRDIILMQCISMYHILCYTYVCREHLDADMRLENVALVSSVVPKRNGSVLGILSSQILHVVQLTRSQKQNTHSENLLQCVYVFVNQAFKSTRFQMQIPATCVLGCGST